MWFESVYDNDHDPYEEAFEIADFERRFRRETDVYDDYCNDYKPLSNIFKKISPKLNVSLLVLQNGSVKLNMFFNKN